VRALLSLAVVFALVAASAAYGTRSAARIWLATPTTVGGSGFPAGKVTVTERMDAQKSVRIVRASRTGRFTARFDTPIKTNGCQAVATVTAVAASGVRATLQVPGNAKECPPPSDLP
jgi:hypothetical protein